MKEQPKMLTTINSLEKHEGLSKKFDSKGKGL